MAEELLAANLARMWGRKPPWQAEDVIGSPTTPLYTTCLGFPINEGYLGVSSCKGREPKRRTIGSIKVN